MRGTKPHESRDKIQNGMRRAVNTALSVLTKYQSSSYDPNSRARKLLATICQDKVDAAKEGDTDAAREILNDYIKSVDRSQRKWQGPNHHIFAAYIAQAFQRILDGEDPERALGIKRGQAGRPRGTKQHNHQALAAGFWLLRKRDLQTEEATNRLIEISGASRSTIQTARNAPYTTSFESQANEAELLEKVTGQHWGQRFLHELDELA